MRRLAAAAALALLAGALTGCTPKPVPIVALAMRDGKPVGVFVTCPGTFATFSLYENSGRSSPGGPPAVHWSISGTADTDLVEVTLFGAAPAGWEVRENTNAPIPPGNLDVVLDPMTQLLPATRYSVGGLARYQAIDVDFTTDDFGRIGADQVLGATDSGATKLMPREKFLRAAHGHCQ